MNINQSNIAPQYDQNTLFFIVMTYVTIKITCNVIFFNHVQITTNYFIIRCTQSSFLYPLIFILSTWITIAVGRKQAIYIILFASLMDGFFSEIIFLAHFINIPTHLSPEEQLFTLSIHAISIKTWELFYHGILGALTAYITEIFLFLFILRHLKVYWLSAITSVAIVERHAY